MNSWILGVLVLGLGAGSGIHQGGGTQQGGGGTVTPQGIFPPKKKAPTPKKAVIPSVQLPVAAPAPPVVPVFSFQGALSQPETFLQTQILERTPMIDGLLEQGEWDTVIGTTPLPVAPLAPMLVPGPGMPSGTLSVEPLPENPVIGSPKSPAGAIPASPVPAEPNGVVLQGAIGSAVGGVVSQAVPAATAMAAPGVPSGYLAWQPDTLFIGAMVPTGDDLVISIDGKADGFLVGKDNLEVRVNAGGSLGVTARILDATNAAGPTWVPAPGYGTAARLAAQPASNGMTFVEVALTDPGYGIFTGTDGEKLGIRLDAVPAATPPSQPFWPRLLNSVTLVSKRVTGAMPNLKYQVQSDPLGTMPGLSTDFRWNFTVPEGFAPDTFHTSAEGPWNNLLNDTKYPFPTPDSRSRVDFDFPSLVSPKAPIGYCVIQGAFGGGSGSTPVIEQSYRIVPLITIEGEPLSVKGDASKPQRITGKVVIRCNNTLRLSGTFQVVPPDGWKVLEGTDKQFFAYGRRTNAKRTFVLEAPAGVTGSFLVTLRALVLGKTYEQPFWVTIR